MIRIAALTSALVLTALAPPAPSLAEQPGRAAVAEIGFGTAEAEAEDGPIRVVLTTAPPVEGDDSDFAKPTLEIYENGEFAAAMLAEGSGLEQPPATAAITDIDPDHPGKEVVFDAWTGGAHCCAEVFVATPGKGGMWQFHEAGAFGGGIGLEDLDGDGLTEIVARDEAFQYAFGCYACSLAPLKILVFADGEIRDATREPRFVSAHREALEDYRKEIEAGDGPLGNGFLAGWVAMKVLVGEGKDGWQTMLRRYDRDDTWGLDECLEQEADLSCKPENQVKREFPEALKAFLDENGYEF
jgi:hypothetical protein